MAVPARSFLGLFHTDSIHKSYVKMLLNAKEGQRIHARGLSGSSDLCFFSDPEIQKKTNIIIAEDYESAQYLRTDLKNLLPDKSCLYFPASFRKAYEYEHVDNANVVLRAEVLNTILNTQDSVTVVTYPDALVEKVLNKKSFSKNSFKIKKNDNLGPDFLSEVLIDYGFEKTDFVYEAGQFAIRGGIVDLFSYANELPYRIEFFGDEVESIRTFDPESQLSKEILDFVNIIPNIQERLSAEEHVSLMSLLPKGTVYWIKDFNSALNRIQKSYEKIEDRFQELVEQSSGTLVTKEPDLLYDDKLSVRKYLEKSVICEFGNSFSKKCDLELVFETKPQPSFNKNFNLLLKDLQDYSSKSYELFIAADQPAQFQRLVTIFDELDANLRFQHLSTGLREGFIDNGKNVLCYTDHQIFERYYRYKEKKRFSKSKSLTLKELNSLQPGDYVTHSEYGVARFTGLETLDNKGRKQEALRLIFKDNDMMLVSVTSLHKIAKYSSRDGSPPLVSKLGSQEWENKKKSVKRKVKDIAKELISLYAKRRTTPGFQFSDDNYLQAELESSFIYEDTPDQAKATKEVKEDMQRPNTMDRLVCGDVGFGKTEVAIRAAFKAVNDSKQVAVLVPTTILAVQHYKTFKNRLEGLPCRVEYINRFRTTKEIKETLKRLKEGKTDILIGTHRIVGKDVVFKDLGLLIIDEEQKFGVKVKDKLKEFKLNVDVLTLTATPIPRTLHFSLMGARDLSVIETPPPNRQPVKTRLHVFDDEIVRDAISFELSRNGQVFFVHNRVKDIESIGDKILRLVPEAKIGIAHGQMEGSLLEKTMMKFIEGEYDILVCTNIIESGLDIPNSNTIVINNAQNFGLSDLHQMRGRVGRSNTKAYCYLFTPAESLLSSESRKRLAALEEFSDLGDGFKVAMRDLDIRGAGDLLGSEQSGFINDLGFDMYHKILDEAVTELKENEFKDLFSNEISETAKALVSECSIESDMELIIPESYIPSISERLSIYGRMDNAKDIESLESLRSELIDRFGPMPDAVDELFKTVHLRWDAERLGMEKLILKNESFKAYFLPSERKDFYDSEMFGKIIHYVQSHGKSFKLKETGKRLILISENIRNIDQAIELLSSMARNVTGISLNKTTEPSPA